jgi:hypothetical protein
VPDHVVEPDAGEPFWIAVGKLVQQQRLYDAEDGRVQSDAQRERQHSGCGEAGRLPQGARGEAEVAAEIDARQDRASWMGSRPVGARE